MNLIEQTWKAQGHSDSDIARMSAVMNNPEACKHALETKDFDAAYKMTLPQERPQINLSDWLSSFAQERPNDAESLSIALTEFAEFVQSKVEKKAP